MAEHTNTQTERVTRRTSLLKLGGAVAAKNPLPPTIWGYNDKVEAYAYDPDKAKSMLEGAGVKDLAVDLWYQPVSRPYNLDGKKMGELMQADLAKVGTPLQLMVRGKALPAKVAAMPFTPHRYHR